jgi:excisionase family DNA binding protein
METIDSAPRHDTAATSSVDGERSYYSISQAAARLGVSRVSVWRWIRAGQLPVARLGHRTVRIGHGDLERLLLRVGADGAAARLDQAPSSRPAAFDAPPPEAGAVGDAEHIVQFYEADALLLDAVAEYIGGSLRAGGAGIVIATPEHRQGLDERLDALGLDLPSVRASGRYVPLDAAETQARFMVGRTPDPGLFVDVVGGVVARAAELGGVRAFGEMVALLAVEGNHAAAIRLEQLWNDLQRTRTFSLFCAYPMARLGGEALAALVSGVCAEHSRVIPAESFIVLPPEDRLRAVARLQQKATWLEAEIEQRKQAEERLRAALASERAAREAAEQALRTRDEFLSVAAHELKTPVTSLSGYAQLILRRLARDGRLDPDWVVEALGEVMGQASRLTRLLSHLLDSSRLEAGRLALEPRPTDLAALVAQAVSGARATSDRHTVALTAPPSLEAVVDPLRLEQVLANLLDNAIKYSPDGGPIEVALSQPLPGAVELSVRDHGIGIPPERRGQIFERFYQAHDNGHRSGIGLGLYISRQIVELHGGEIRAEFPSDGGTRFVVSLPTGSDPAAPLEERSSRAEALSPL